MSATLVDLDGVLVDTVRLHRRVWREYVAGCPYPALRSGAPRGTGRRALDVLREVLGDALDDAAREAIVAGLYEHFLALAGPPGHHLSRGAAALLEAAQRRGPVVVATNSPPRVVDHLLGPAAAGLDAVVTAAECRRGKPDGEIYRRAAARAGTEPASCLGVEDTAVGIRAIRAAGCRAVAVAGTESPSALLAAGAELVLPNLRALVPLIEESAAAAPVSGPGSPTA